MAKDLVCGMDVDEREATEKGLKSEYQGQAYYFCGPGCKRQFDKDPEAFIKRQPATGG